MVKSRSKIIIKNKHKNIKITHKNKQQNGNIKQYIIKKYLNKFPYVNKIYTKDEIFTYLDKIKNTTYKFEHLDKPLELHTFKPKNNKILSLFLGAIDLFDISNSSLVEANYIVMDFFSEYCKVKCQHSYSNKMPIQLFEIPSIKQKIAHNLLKLLPNNTTNILLSNIDNIINKNKYLLSTAISNTIYFCNYFRPSLVLQILHHFKPNSVLDMSAGWGDRLLGCILYGCNYIGFDPSECMYPVYQKIISNCSEYYDKTTKNKLYVVEKIGFENSMNTINKLRNENKEITDGFDLILSSPPYFDLEQYETNATSGQSFIKYNGFHNWLINFMFASLQILWTNLKFGGKMVLYIDDITSSEKKYIWSEPVIYFCIEKLLNCSYLGMIYTKSTNIRQCFVFEKVLVSSNKINKEIGTKNMEKYYPEINKILKIQ